MLKPWFPLPSSSLPGPEAPRGWPSTPTGRHLQVPGSSRGGTGPWNPYGVQGDPRRLPRFSEPIESKPINTQHFNLPFPRARPCAGGTNLMLHKPGLRAHPSASVSPSTIGRGTSVRAGQAPGTRFPSDKVPTCRAGHINSLLERSSGFCGDQKRSQPAPTASLAQPDVVPADLASRRRGHRAWALWPLPVPGLLLTPHLGASALRGPQSIRQASGRCPSPGRPP